jgi:hypothetical protein
VGGSGIVARVAGPRSCFYPGPAAPERRGLGRIDVPAVDDEVGAGDVAGPVAREQDHEVGAPVARPTDAATPSVPSQRSVETGPALTVFTRSRAAPCDHTLRPIDEFRFVFDV